MGRREGAALSAVMAAWAPAFATSLLVACGALSDALNQPRNIGEDDGGGPGLAAVGRQSSSAGLSPAPPISGPLHTAQPSCNQAAVAHQLCLFTQLPLIAPAQALVMVFPS